MQSRHWLFVIWYSRADGIAVTHPASRPPHATSRFLSFSVHAASAIHTRSAALHVAFESACCGLERAKCNASTPLT